MSRTSILVTGGAGYIGSHVVLQLRARGEQVVVLDDSAAETTPTAPINAYGTSKLMSEWMLRDVAASSPLRYVALRYFNVAGSDSGGRIGQATRKATLLIKVACEAVVGKRQHVSIFG